MLPLGMSAPARSSSVIVATAIASLAFLATGFVVVQGLGNIRNASDVINVTGSARRNITSDLAVWTFTVRSSDDSTLQSAYRGFRGAQPAMEAFLGAQKFAQGELRREPVNAGPQTYTVIESVNGENTEVQRTRYVVSQRYRIQSRDIARLQGLATDTVTTTQQLDDLVGAGIQRDAAATVRIVWNCILPIVEL